MNISYKITQLDQQLGSIRVIYWTEDYPSGYLFDLDLPVENGQTLSAEQLTEWIMARAPRAQLEWAANQKQLFSTVDLSHIEALVDPGTALNLSTITTSSSNIAPSAQAAAVINEMIPSTTV
jgi:hypothetical protein